MTARIIIAFVILDYCCSQTERLWRGLASAAFPTHIQQIARRKLRMVSAAASLDDLRLPPGNALETARMEAPGERRKARKAEPERWLCLLHIYQPFYLLFEWRNGCASRVQVRDCAPVEDRQVWVTLRNVSPGEVLQEEFLLPLGINMYRLAQSLDVNAGRVGAILRGEESISAEMALRLSAFLGTTPQFWLSLQMEYDLEEAARQLVPELPLIARFHA